MEEIIKMIREADSVVILPHINADGDAIGSCAAMAELLGALEKKTVIKF